MSYKLFFVILVILTSFSFAYLPGYDRKKYLKGDFIEVKTRKLASKKNLPFEFYSLQFCKPNPKRYATETFGEVLFGDRIENSLYLLQMDTPVKCRRLDKFVDPICTNPQTQYCTPIKPDCPKQKKETIDAFKMKIDDDYEAQLIIDGLPVANLQDAINCGDHPHYLSNIDTSKYQRPDGFPIGCKSADGKFYINNHLTFKMKYYKKDGEYVVVGAAVIPSSIKHDGDSCQENADLKRTPKLELTDDLEEIVWSYSVEWEESNVPWALRWDAYISVGDKEEYKIHWFSIINSLLIVLFLTGMVAMIMMRALYKDIAIYNAEDDDPTDETGWKLVHGDVFRTPTASTLLSILAGSGVQVFGMAIASIIFSALGFLSPSHRGGLATIMLLLFVLMGSFAGYYSLRLYKMFGGESWKLVSVLVALLVPGVVFVIFLGVNAIVFLGSSSSIAVRFGTLVSLFAMWFGISAPLVLLGGYFGFKADKIEHPVQTHKIPRQIPGQPWYMRSPFSILMGGILPFGAVFIELYFIMSSLWLHKFYYVFGFLFIVFIILVLTCSEITIVMIYFQLCNADYHWWWRSFFTSGSSALYLFLYSIFYFVTKIKAVSNFLMGVVFFGYMLIISWFFFVLTGSIGFFSALWFVRKIYSSIKVA